MATADEIWAWVYPAIQELQEGFRSDPEKEWDSRQGEFCYRLGITDARDDPVVESLMRQLSEMPGGERDSVLGSDRLESLAYEVVEVYATEPAAPDDSGAGYDEAAWQAYLTTNGPAWDGTAEAWPGFRSWFEYYAAAQGLSAPATGLPDDLESLPVPERIAEFWRRGVTIAAPQPSGAEFGWVTREQWDVLEGLWGPQWQAALSDDLTARWGEGWQAHPDEHKAAWLADLIAAGEFGGGPETPSQDAAEAESEEAILDEFAEILAEIPGIDELSEDELAKIIAEAIGQTEG